MPTEDLMHLDEETARDLLKTAPRMKPIGVSRAYKVKRQFQIVVGQPAHAGDYLILTPKGEVCVLSKNFVDSNFEPVAKRTTKEK